MRQASDRKSGLRRGAGFALIGVGIALVAFSGVVQGFWPALVVVAAVVAVGVAVLLLSGSDSDPAEPGHIKSDPPLLEEFGLGLVNWHANVGKVEVNPVAARLLELKDLTVSSDRLLSQVAPTDRQSLIESVNACAFVGTPIEVSFETTGARTLRAIGVRKDGRVALLLEDTSATVIVQRAIDEVKTQYQRMVDNIPGAVYQMMRFPDGSRKVPYISVGVEQIFGVTAEQVYADADLLIEAIHPEDRVEKELLAQKSMQELCHFDWTGRISRPDGEVRWIHALCIPRRLEGGVIHWDGVILDVTAEKMAEIEHVGTKERLAWLLKSSPVVIYACRPEPPYQLTYLSDNAGDLLGLDLHGYMTDPHFWQKRIHPDDDALNLEILDEIGDGGHRTIEYRFQAQSGEYIWIRDEMRLVVENGKREIVGTVVDVTERRQAQQARRESDERFRAMSNASPLGIFVIGEESQVVYANATLAEILNAPQDALLKSGLFELVYSEDRLRVDERISEALRRHEPTSVQCRFTLEGREAIWCTIKTAPLFGAGLVGTVEDVTERHELELQSEQARIEAERANRAKSAYLSRISHELRTPLHAIMGFAQLLEISRLDQDQKESVEQILAGGRHLVSLINDVLDIARAESGELHVGCVPISLKHVIDEAVSLLSPLARDKGVLVDVKVRERDAVTVLADKKRLLQIVLNLLANAIKYNKREGSVIVTCEQRSDGYIDLVVRDTGSGIPVDKFERLFTPFDRLGAEESSVEGSGLGLILTKRLTEAMGGNLRLDSDVRTGTVATVSLRSSVPAPMDHAVVKLPTIERPARRGTRRLLVVEDHEPSLKLMEGALIDYDVEFVRKGRHVVERALESSPQLILLDANLPDVAGIALLEEIKRNPFVCKCPVIIVSADAEAKTRDRFLGAGAAAYVEKPMDVHALLRTIEDVLAEVSV